MFNTNQYVIKYIVDPLSCLHYSKKINPVIITFVSLVLTFVSYLALCDKLIFDILVIFSGLIRPILDRLDGYIARKYNKLTEFGAFMDTMSNLFNACNFSTSIWIKLVGRYSLYFFVVSCAIFLIDDKIKDIQKKEKISKKRDITYDLNFENIVYLFENNTVLIGFLSSVFLVFI